MHMTFGKVQGNWLNRPNLNLKTNLIRIIISLCNQLLRFMLILCHINFILIQPGAPDSTDFSTVIDRGVFL